MLGHPGDIELPAGGIILSARLADKRCLIVGGTSGIGKATAARFLEEGALVAIAGHDADHGAQASEELHGIGRVRFIPCDATRSYDADNAVREATKVLGGLDVLFHVAGASGRKHGDGRLHDCTDDGWRFTLDVNLTSTFLTNRAAVRYFLDRKQGGCILNMASMLALSPSPRHFDTVAYAAAKAGVIGMSRLLASSYAADGIRVNVLAPGLVDTPMAARAANDPAVRGFLQSKQPLSSGPLSPEGCADAAVFLCGDESRTITGVVLPVDGGWGVC